MRLGGGGGASYGLHMVESCWYGRPPLPCRLKRPTKLWALFNWPNQGRKIGAKNIYLYIFDKCRRSNATKLDHPPEGWSVMSQTARE